VASSTDRAACSRSPTPTPKPVSSARSAGHLGKLAHRAIFFGLGEHPREQFLARNAVGIAGMVVRAGDQRGAARAAIEQPDREVEAREIDCRGQTRGSGADDDAIVHRVQTHQRGMFPLDLIW
jgi:hypothetical protein